MRLLNTTTLELTTFVDPPRWPDSYAILSHTWTDEELSFQDLSDLSGLASHRNKKGFLKILQCCKIALADGFEKVWIDTVCIDKTSSAELSEAINSMFSWYQKANKCYVYLEDLDTTTIQSGALTLPAPAPELAACRWFTRGWTLQELLAPDMAFNVVFLDKNWTVIGNRATLALPIAHITGIDVQCLMRHRNVTTYSVAQRMSWASSRKVTRAEDIAYCLLGLFGVHMPLLYGEGGIKAFLRLQQEILSMTQDQTIFTWDNDDRLHNFESVGLLAPRPAAFKGSQSFVPALSGLCRSEPISATAHGVAFKATVAQVNVARYIVLECRGPRHPSLVLIPITRLYGNAGWQRRGLTMLQETPPEHEFKKMNLYVPHDSVQLGKFQTSADMNDWLGVSRLPAPGSGFVLSHCWPEGCYDEASGVLRMKSAPNGPVINDCVGLHFKHKANQLAPFTVMLTSGNPYNQRGWEGVDARVFPASDPMFQPTFETGYYFEQLVTQWYRDYETQKDGGIVGDPAGRVMQPGGHTVRLHDLTYVHICVEPLNHMLWLEGGLTILAGLSWQDDVLTPTTQHRYEQWLRNPRVRPSEVPIDDFVILP